MAITVVKGFILTKARFVNNESEKYGDMGLNIDSYEYDDFRIKASEIISWNSSDYDNCTTIRTNYNSFTITESIEDMDILMLSGKL